MQKVTFNTIGDGYWSEHERAVDITNMVIGYINDENDFGELCVFFDTKTWNCYEHGLIYTDKLFMRELREFLISQGLPGNDVTYSEQGMQGDNYVSCDIGEKFLKAWSLKFSKDFN
jgi:hypothetical protein